jgi:hypothetical protein
VTFACGLLFTPAFAQPTSSESSTQRVTPSTWQFDISVPAFTVDAFSFAADDLTVVLPEPNPSR